MPRPQVAFNLPGFAIDSVQSHPDVVLVEAHPTTTAACCPQCAAPATRVHSTYTRIPRDLPISDVRVQLMLHLRRFFCDIPTCAQRTFAERLPEILPVRAQRTVRLTQALAVLGFALGGRAGARTARRLAVPTSRDTLVRVVRATPVPVVSPPRVLGVDDFALRKGRVYGSILVDLEHHRPIDLLPDRSAETLAAWLEAHPSVAVIARDRSTEYTRGATMGAPAALQVADRWHILKNQREALERMLNRLHVDLSRLPDVAAPAGAPQSSTRPRRPRRLRAMSAAEQAAQQAARKRRLARYQQVQTLVAQGVPILQIATQLSMSRATATAFAAAATFPERAANRAQPSGLDPYLPILQECWHAGCVNASQLWRELKALGYLGGRRQVARWVQQQRSEPAATTPKKYGFRSSETGTEDERTTAPTLAAPRQLVWLLLRKPAQLAEEEAAVVARLQQHPEVRQAQALAHDFQAMVRQRKPEAFDAWLQACADSGIAELQSFAKGLMQEESSIRAALSEPWSSGQVEGQVTRLKLLKRQMYGRAKFDLLRQRVLHAA